MRAMKVDILVNFMVEVPEGTNTDDLYIQLPEGMTVEVMDKKGTKVAETNNFYTDEVVVQDDVVIVSDQVIKTNY